jgi:hypothetical protein
MENLFKNYPNLEMKINIILENENEISEFTC